MPQYLCNGCDDERDEPGPAFCASCDDITETYEFTGERLSIEEVMAMIGANRRNAIFMDAVL